MNQCKRPPQRPSSPAPSKRAKVKGSASSTFPLQYWSPSYQLSLNVYISGFYLHGLLRFFAQELLASVQEQGVPATDDKVNAITHDFLLAEWTKGKIRFLCSNVGLCALEDGRSGDPPAAYALATTNGEAYEAQDCDAGKVAVLPSSKRTPADGGDFAKSRDESPVQDVKKARGEEEVCASAVNTDQMCVVQTKKVSATKSKVSQTCTAVKEVMQQSEQSIQTDTRTVTTALNTDTCASCKNCAAQISESCRQNLHHSPSSSQTLSDGPHRPDSAPKQAAHVHAFDDRWSLRKIILKPSKIFRPKRKNLVQLTRPFVDDTSEESDSDQAGGAEAQAESVTSPVDKTWLKKAFSPNAVAQPVRGARAGENVLSGFTYSASSTNSNYAQLNSVDRGKTPPLPVSNNTSQSSKRRLKAFTSTGLPTKVPRPSDIANYRTLPKKRASKKNTSQTLSTPNQQKSHACMARRGSAAQNIPTPPLATQIRSDPVQPVFLQPATLSGHGSGHPQQESLTQLIEHQFDHMAQLMTGQTPAALGALSDKTGNPAVSSNPVAAGRGQAGNVAPASLHENQTQDGVKKPSRKIALMKSLLNQIEAVVSAKMGAIPTHHQHPTWKQDEEANSLGVSADHVKFDGAKAAGHVTGAKAAGHVTVAKAAGHVTVAKAAGHVTVAKAAGHVTVAKAAGHVTGAKAAGHVTVGIVAETVSSELKTTGLSESKKSVDESGPWQKSGFSVHRNTPSLHKTAKLNKYTGENAYSPSEPTPVYHEQVGAVCKSVSTSQTSSSHFFEGRVPSLDEIPLPDEKPQRSCTHTGSKVGESPVVGLSPGIEEVPETSPGVQHSGVQTAGPETSPGVQHSSVQTAGPEDAGTAREQGQTSQTSNIKIGQIETLASQTSHASDVKREQIETLASQIQMIVGKLRGGCALANVGLSPSQETLSPGTSCTQDSSSIPSASPSTHHTLGSAGSSEGASSEGTPSQAACPWSDPIQPEHGSSCATASAQSPSSTCFLPGTTGEKKGLGIRKYVDANHNTDISKAVESVIARKISSLIRNRSNLSASAIREQCSHLISRCLAKVSPRKGERRHPGVAADPPRKKDRWMMTSRPHCVNRRIMTDPILMSESSAGTDVARRDRTTLTDVVARRDQTTLTDVVARRDQTTLTDVVARRDRTTLTDSWTKDAWTTTRRFKPCISRASQTVRRGVAEVGTGTELLPQQGRTTLGTPSKTTPTTNPHQPGQVIAEQLTTTTTCQEMIQVDGEEVGHHRALVQNISHCVLTDKGQPAGVTPGSTGAAAADHGTVRITIKVKVAKGSNIRLAS